MKKDEYIATYGIEQYNKYLEKARQKNKRYLSKSEEIREQARKRSAEWRAANSKRHKESTRNWEEKNKEQRKAYKKQYIETHGDYMTKEERRDYQKAYNLSKKNDPVYKLKKFIRRKKERLKTVSPEEAMTLLTKEANECGLPEILNMDFMLYRFNDNCKHGLVYGNIEILKYFYRLMQIKVCNGEEFTENDKNLIHYFRNSKFGKVKTDILELNNDWILKPENIDMAYIEDMVRNVKGLDLFVSEEDYLEKKG